MLHDRSQRRREGRARVLQLLPMEQRKRSQNLISERCQFQQNLTSILVTVPPYYRTLGYQSIR
jgi:hypothetical protein